MTGLVEAVCVVFADIPQPRKIPFTAIDKRPVEGSVMVRVLGVEGDHVCDTKHHGGLSEDSRLRLDRALTRAARR